MASFSEVLEKITTASQIAQAGAGAIAEIPSDPVAATQHILLITGAGVAAESTDSQVQQEAVAAAQLAANLTPLVFSLVQLFKKK